MIQIKKVSQRLRESSVKKYNNTCCSDSDIILNMRKQHQEQLTILKYRHRILRAIKQERVVVISGKTGCGKSTQMPQMVLEEDKQAKIAVCQPRRIAATSLAKRVAFETRTQLGTVVGYQIGMETKSSNQTNIVYMTYGIMIQKLLHGKISYSHIILDEVHERSLEMDFCFVILKKILEKSKTKLIIMSATINSEKFAAYFGYYPETLQFVTPKISYNIYRPQDSLDENSRQYKNYQRQRRRERAKKIQIQDDEQYVMQAKTEIVNKNFKNAASIELPDERKYKIKIKYVEGKNQKVRYNHGEDVQIPQEIFQLAYEYIFDHIDHKEGDLLIFVPGIKEINTIKDHIEKKRRIDEDRIVIVHSHFSEDLEKRLFNERIRNKIIISTSMGESSITIPACVAVIDFCFCKKHISDKASGSSKFETHVASQATLEQRAGRTGRVCDGEVYRLITKERFEQLNPFDTPEIQCISLEIVLLKAKLLDKFQQSNIFSDPYEIILSVLDAPKLKEIHNAINFLVQEEALAYNKKLEPGTLYHGPDLQLTRIGEFMGQMPCEFHISKMILCSMQLGIPNTMIDIGALIEYDKKFHTNEDKQNSFEQTIKHLIDYGEGKFNDFLLRQTMFAEWRTRFFEERIARNMKYEKNQGQPNPFEDFDEEIIEQKLQKFLKKRCENGQYDWCHDRGTSHYKMRDILNTSETLRYKIAKYGVLVKRKKETKINNNLIIYCLSAAFQKVSCKVNFQVQSPGKFPPKQSYVILQHDVNIARLSDYLKPFKVDQDYQIIKILSGFRPHYEVYGCLQVLQRLVLPHKFHGKQFNKRNVSEAFLQLIKKQAKSDVGDSLLSDVFSRRYNLKVCGYSINSLVVKPDPSKEYYAISNRFVISKHTNMVEMSALVQESVFFLIRMLTMRKVELRYHPSMEFFTHVILDNKIFKLPFNITPDMLQDIQMVKKLELNRNLATSFDIQQERKEQNQNILIELLESKKQPLSIEIQWDDVFASKIEGINTEKQICVDLLDADPPKTRKPSYFKRYRSWKKSYFLKQYREYKRLLVSQPSVICRQCYQNYNVVNDLDNLRRYKAKTQNFQYDEFRTSWVQKGQDIYCNLNHYLGYIEKGQHVFLEFKNILMYKPIGIVEEFRGDQKSVDRFYVEGMEEGLREIQKQRVNFSGFNCYITCCGKDFEGEDDRYQPKPSRNQKRRKDELHPKYSEFYSHMNSDYYIRQKETFKKGLFDDDD